MNSGKCKYCVNYRNEWCEKVRDSPDPDLERKCYYYKTATNYDRLVSKTPEELARRIAARTACMDCILLEECNRRTGRRRCVDMWLDWLKSPVEGDDG